MSEIKRTITKTTEITNPINDVHIRIIERDNELKFHISQKEFKYGYPFIFDNEIEYVEFILELVKSLKYIKLSLYNRTKIEGLMADILNNLRGLVR